MCVCVCVCVCVRERERESVCVKLSHSSAILKKGWKWAWGRDCINLPTSPEVVVLPFLGLLASVLVLSDDPSS